MTNSADLTTLANVKAWLGKTDTADDLTIIRLVTAASLFIQNVINRNIASQSYTEKYNGSGTRILSLPNYPITAVSSLAIDGVTISASPAVNQTGYVFSPTQIMLNGHCFTRGFQNVAITYAAGFVSTPYDIEQACIELCAVRFKERDRIGQVSKSIAGEVIAFTQKDVPADVQMLLNQYKRVVTV